MVTDTSNTGMQRGAELSLDNLYRYRLWRVWGDGDRRCVFVGVNPSTADATKDDPTIRKCVGFAKRWGFGALDMVNLFAFRSTDQRVLCDLKDPVGPENADSLREVLDLASRVVWAWGSGKTPGVRRLIDAELERSSWYTMPNGCEAGTLGRTKDGYPRHPLMLSYATPFRVG
jgi:hypothetical protein